MIKNGKILLWCIFFFLEAECFRNQQTYSQYYKHYNPQLSYKREQFQIPKKLDVSSSMATLPEINNHWQYQQETYSPTTVSSSTAANVIEWKILMEREKTLQHMSNKIITYFMAVAVQDFEAKLSQALKRNKLYIDKNEEELIKKKCSKCSYKDLKNHMDSLLIIFEKYPPLAGNVTLAGHIATEYEKACDFLYKKFKRFKSDIEDLNSDEELRDLKKQYMRKEINGGLMTTLVNWFEIFSKSEADNSEDIQRKLIKYLTALKRYWLISIKGVFFSNN